jgi:hypothetical protein
VLLTPAWIFSHSSERTETLLLGSPFNVSGAASRAKRSLNARGSIRNFFDVRTSGTIRRVNQHGAIVRPDASYSDGIGAAGRLTCNGARTRSIAVSWPFPRQLDLLPMDREEGCDDDVTLHVTFGAGDD